MEKTKHAAPMFSNPVIAKLHKMAQDGIVAERTSTTATYVGIAMKTGLLLAMAIVGYVVFFILHGILMKAAGANTLSFTSNNNVTAINTCLVEVIIFAVTAIISLFAPMLAFLIRPAIPVAGSLYAISEGYMIGFITSSLTAQYKWIALAAFVLTIGVVVAMLLLYMTRIIQVGSRFRTILFGLVLSMIIGGIAAFILSLIPFTRSIMVSVMTFMGSPVVSLVFSVIYLVIAILFLISDFSSIEECVNAGMDKKYEWVGAWGLAYSIIFIYLKILQLIMKAASNSKNN